MVGRRLASFRARTSTTAPRYLSGGGSTDPLLVREEGSGVVMVVVGKGVIWAFTEQLANSRPRRRLH